MSIIYVLIPIAILFVCIGLGIFFWAVRSKQFDDLDKEAYSILFDNANKSSKPEQQPEDPPLIDTISPDGQSPLITKKGL
jgi:cbb3-type cytochrome oxidase maturation protein